MIRRHATPPSRSRAGRARALPRAWAPLRAACSLAVAALALSLAGCPEDPYDAQTWIDKLDDPDEVRTALTRLEQLKDPKAIKALGRVWETQGRPQSVLKIMIEIADQTEEKDGPFWKNGPYWDDAVPVLIKAMDFDVADQRSVENAIIAADALGKAGAKEAIQPLISAVNKSMPKLSPGQRVRLAAILALGKFPDEPRAVDTLLKVLGSDPEQQPIPLFSAGANALADARSEKAILPLLETAYKLSAIFNQCRLALIAIGKPVIPELMKVFEGKHKELNSLAKEYKFNIDCDKEMGPDTKCQAPSNLQFKAASLLGDMYAKEAVKMLTAALKQPPLPAFFQQGAPGPAQHNAILDSLRKIADSSAAAAVQAYWADPKTEDYIRPMAIDVYSYLTTDTSALGDLAKLIKDDEADEQIRLAAGLTYARLVRSEGQLEPLTYMVNRYRKEADKHEASLKKAEKAYEAADKAHKAAQAKADADKGNKRLAESAKKTQGALEAKGEEKSLAESQMAAYRNFQRTFEEHLARAQVGITCKRDPECHAAFLEPATKEFLESEAKADKAEERRKRLAEKVGEKPAEQIEEFDKAIVRRIDGFKKRTKQDKDNFHIAAIERAVIELLKMGDKARPVFDKVLKHAESTDRITRQGLLLVMVHSAELPCDRCVKRLDEIIELQQDQSTLSLLTSETKAVRNYFLWAGK